VEQAGQILFLIEHLLEQPVLGTHRPLGQLGKSVFVQFSCVERVIGFCCLNTGRCVRYDLHRRSQYHEQTENGAENASRFFVHRSVLLFFFLEFLEKYTCIHGKSMV